MASSGTTTTFDGAAVRSGADAAATVPVGTTDPERHVAVEQVERDDPDEQEAHDREQRRRDRADRPDAVRVAGARRPRPDHPRHDAAATSPGTGARQDDGRLGVRPAGRGVADLQLERFEPAERAAGEARDDIDHVALLHECRDVDSPERDPVEDVTIAPQRHRGVVRAGLAHPEHGQPEHRDERLRVAGSVRGQGGQLAVEGVVDAERRQREVDGEDGPRIRGHGTAGDRLEAFDERGPALGGQLEPGRPGVPAVPREQVGARLQGRPEVHGPVAAARGADRVAELRPDDRRPRAVFRQPRGDEADDADRPRTVHDRRGSVRVGRDEGACLLDGRAHEVAAGTVGDLERIGVGRGFGGILREQEPGRLQRLPHAPGRVQARRQRKRDRVEVHVRRGDPGTLQERSDPGPGCAAHPLEAQSRDRSVLAHDRRHVGDGSDGRQVGEGKRGRGTARFVGQDQLRDLEGDAAAGQAHVRVRASRRDAG